MVLLSASSYAWQRVDHEKFHIPPSFFESGADGTSRTIFVQT